MFNPSASTTDDALVSKAAKLSDAEKSKRSPQTQPARKKQKLEPVNFSDSNSLVTFIVDKEGETAKFTAHKEVICYHLKVLNAAFNSTFVEGQTQTYRLEDTSEEVFKLFMQWIYFQRFTLKQLDDTRKLEKWEHSSENHSLVALWMLADKFCMPRLQNFTLKTIEDISEKHTSIYTPFNYVYKNTTPGSLLRQYLVASLAWADEIIFAGRPEMYHHEMIIDFAVHMIKNKDRSLEYLDVSDYFVGKD